ncbi:MAG: hypothetical protein HLUCCO17_07190 [Saliniramus fredricksonii]|uniref:Uncharacterized protein n=1 Tax=Saliniramus fredricksonii TaxID=1653334 RepID=A0A0P7X870_9HYPH|nr:hypothetical protein [Saliniramus fredricksonii]KPQ11416.1 MAG: hypothetical protein HLUCCO17_07190 [Saliniramus fredricksonii]SCC81934.1 hypothetical protein GA0071312_2907 [Saliniramus fredricksonii]
MKAFVAAAIFAILAAVGAAFLLDGSFQTTAYQAYATEGVRLGDPGSNLVDF